MSDPASTAPTTARSTHARRGTVALAWAATLLLSGILQVFLVEVAGIDSPPMTVIWVAIAASMLVLAGTWDVARPLREYVLVMLAVIAATYVLLPLASRWTASTDTGSGLRQVLWTRVLMIAVALGMAAFLVLALRRRPRVLFLTRGDLRAPSGVRLPGTGQPLTWAALGTIATVLLVTGFATQMWLDSAFPGQGWHRLLASAPLIVAAAALNAFSEEVLFRVGPLAALHPVVGPRQAILITSAWFGLAHCYGSIPSGPVGAVQSGLLGLLLGTAMMATRGLGWPVLIHFGIDVVVFTSIAVAFP